MAGSSGMLFRFRGDLVLMTCRELCRCVVEERELRDSDFSEVCALHTSEGCLGG